MKYVTGETIKTLREKQGLTQKQLAIQLHVSDKTISKWETNRGLPDISLLTELAAALRISVAELLSGGCMENQNRAANLKRMHFYVCPICGNIIQSVGEGAYSCCGVLLPPLEAEESEGEHLIQKERMDGEWYIHVEHPMEKGHFISFLAYVTTNRIAFCKLYPEQTAEARFPFYGHGKLYALCNRHGLYCIHI